jgi:hypothetical protein
LARKSRRLILMLLSMAVALLALGISACGGDDGGSGGGGGDDDVNAVLKETFSKEKKIDSGKLSVNLTAKLEGVQQISGPISVKVSGPFENVGENRFPRVDLDLTASASGQTFRAGAVSNGDKGFVSFQGTNYVLPDSQFRQLKRQVEQAAKQNDDSSSPEFGALGINPRNWLKDAKEVGTENVAGAETTHISADVDVAKLLDDVDHLLKRSGELGLNQQQQQQLPKSIPESTKKQIIDAVKEASFDLYTGKDDKTLRRLDLEVAFEVPEDARKDVQGLKSGNIDFSIEISDLNQGQKIVAPKNARPLKELQQQLGATGFGSLGGSSGSGSTGSSGSGSSAGSTVDSATQRKYLKCVQKASGTDELRQCANLLK